MRKAVFLLLLFPVLSQAEVFKCMNDSGHVTYSERPCVTGAVSYDAARASIGGSTRSVSIPRGTDGIFRASGSVNSQPVNFVIDTGANMTTLSGDIAYRIGVRNCVPAGVSNTANGQTFFCRVTLSKLTLAGFNFTNVSVAINPTMKGDALFGNDLLNQFTIQQQGNLLSLSR